MNAMLVNDTGTKESVEVRISALLVGWGKSDKVYNSMLLEQWAPTPCDIC